MVVMKMSTMKAHTRLDLKTSSLIWEYCKARRGRGGERERLQTDGEQTDPSPTRHVTTPKHAPPAGVGGPAPR